MDHGLRRERLAAALLEDGIGALLVTSLPNVRYLTGFTGSNGQAIVGSVGVVFLTDGRYEEQSRHEVPDVERRTYADGFAEAVAGACRDLGVSRLGFEAESMTYGAHARLAEHVPEPIPVAGAVESLRLIKDGEELALLEAAQAITDAAFDAVPGLLRDGVTEREVALGLELTMRRAGAEGVAFDPIVAFGELSAEPHHEPTGRPLRRGDVVKLDFGARVGGYHADMTRTISFGEPPAELREVYDVVRAAEAAGAASVRPGVRAADVDAAARRVIEEAGLGPRFPHGLGHGVGLEIHEGPWLRRTSEDVLPAGTVVTVEPGVYLPGVGGVRIEDMVHVADDGGRVLAGTSKELMVL